MPGRKSLAIASRERLVVWPKRHDLLTNFRVSDAFTTRLDVILQKLFHGFRSIPVVARFDGHGWTTAMVRYPDVSWSQWVKAAIRRVRDLEVGDEAQVHLRTLSSMKSVSEWLIGSRQSNGI